MKPCRQFGQTRQASSQRNPARAISTLWYSRRATATSSLWKKWRITHPEKWFGHIKSSSTICMPLELSPSITSLTTNALTSSKKPWSLRRWTITAVTAPRRPSRPSKIILWQFSAEPIRSFYSISGIYFYPKPRTCLTCFDHLGWLQPCQHMPTYGVSMITIQTHLRHLVAELKPIWYQALERHGNHTRHVDYKLAIHGIIIAATTYSSVTHVTYQFAAQYFSSTNTSLCPH